MNEQTNERTSERMGYCAEINHCGRERNSIYPDIKIRFCLVASLALPERRSMDLSVGYNNGSTFHSINLEIKYYSKDIPRLDKWGGGLGTSECLFAK